VSLFDTVPLTILTEHSTDQHTLRDKDWKERDFARPLGVLVEYRAGRFFINDYLMPQRLPRKRILSSKLWRHSPIAGLGRKMPAPQACGKCGRWFKGEIRVGDFEVASIFVVKEGI